MIIKRFVIKNHPQIDDMELTLSRGINLLPRECAHVFSMLFKNVYPYELSPSPKKMELYAYVELEIGDDTYEISLKDSTLFYSKNGKELVGGELINDKSLLPDTLGQELCFYAEEGCRARAPLRYFKNSLFEEYVGGSLCKELIKDKGIYVAYDHTKGYLFLKKLDKSFDNANLSMCDSVELSFWCFLHRVSFHDFYNTSVYGESCSLPLFVFDMHRYLDADAKRREPLLDYALDSGHQIIFFEKEIPITSIYSINNQLNNSNLAFLGSSKRAKQMLDLLNYDYYELEGYFEGDLSRKTVLAVVATEEISTILNIAEECGENSIFYLNKHHNGAYLYSQDIKKEVASVNIYSFPFPVYINGKIFSCISASKI